MHVSSLLLPLLATLAVSAPLARRATPRTFAELSISSGTAGNAKAEADAIFPAPADLAAVSADDLETLKAERETAEAAETDGFNPAIDAAGGKNTDAGTGLQNGKIKNKVLKRELTPRMRNCSVKRFC